MKVSESLNAYHVASVECYCPHANYDEWPFFLVFLYTAAASLRLLTIVIGVVGKALALVQSFSAGWKRSLEELNREILSSFPSLVTGSTLLQLALTQLVQYYHRFHKLLSPNARAQLTNIHHIMVEVKKYKTNF